MKVELEIDDEDLKYLFTAMGKSDSVQVSRYDVHKLMRIRRLCDVCVIKQLPYTGDCIVYHPTYILTSLGRIVEKQWKGEE